LMVVEDGKSQRKMLADFLRAEGHNVLEAEDGPDALAILKDSYIDLMLLDYKMPGMDGMEVLEKAKEITPEIDVIMMTALGSIFSNNLKQVTAQEKNMEAYYLSLSGIDMAMSALMQEDADADTLLSIEYTKTAQANVADTPVLNHRFTVDVGTIDIQISAYEDAANERWVEVTSVGTLDNGVTSKTSKLKFLTENPEIQKIE